MAIPSPEESGNNSVAVAIDRDKGSQWAVKWAVEHLMKGKITRIVLVHVTVFDAQNQAGNVSKDGRPASEVELQQLFLPYRGFCARKGIDTDEVVLQDSDIASALVNYIEMNSIGTMVVGASSRNALTRRFKHTDVPTNLAKLAPYFCTVYAISKGKVQSVRTSSASNTPRASGSNKPYFTKDSGSVKTYTSSKSSVSGNNCSSVSESPSADDQMSITSDNSRNSASSLSLYYNSRLKTLLGQPPVHPQSSSYDDNPRHSYSREGETSDDVTQNPWDITPSRLLQSPSPTSRFTPSPETRSGLRQNPYVRSMLSDGSSYNSSYTNGSYESSEYSRDQSSYASTNSNSSYPESFATENELDEEITSLKQETQKAMNLFQMICDQTDIAKHQVTKTKQGT